MGLFDFLKKKEHPKPAKEADKKELLTVKVVGTEYRDIERIKTLGTINEDFSLDKKGLFKKYPEGCTVSEYDFPKCVAEFEFEPTNEHDPNAIKVLIKGIHVGYVKKGSCARIRNLINQDKIKSISATIKGGNYKSLFTSEIFVDENPKISDFNFEKGKNDFRIILELALKE